MCSLLLCCWKRVFAMTSAFSWQNSVNFCPTSFCSPRPNLPDIPGISWLPTAAFQSLMMNRTSFLGISSRRSSRSSKNWSTSASSTSVVGAWTWIIVMLNGLPWNELRSFCHFWGCTQVLYFRLFCWLWGLLHFFHGILANSSRYNGYLNSPIPIHFSLLIPRM